MKNLKAYEFLLILSIILQWSFSIVVERLSTDLVLKNVDELLFTGAGISFFFYTMIITTIQALIHNSLVLQADTRANTLRFTSSGNAPPAPIRVVSYDYKNIVTFVSLAFIALIILFVYG
jgi:hypothetical protein